MIEIILDTETTGLSTAQDHRIVEIGCIEMNDQIPTNKIFHTYINPEREVSQEAYKVHGYSNEFLGNQKTFKEIANDFRRVPRNNVATSIFLPRVSPTASRRQGWCGFGTLADRVPHGGAPLTYGIKVGEVRHVRCHMTSQ